VALPGVDMETAPATHAPQSEHRSRRARFGGEWHETAVLGPGADRFQGPAILELPGSTLVVPPGWSGRSDGETVVIER